MMESYLQFNIERGILARKNEILLRNYVVKYDEKEESKMVIKVK
jgi:hypothetical protein